MNTRQVHVIVFTAAALLIALSGGYGMAQQNTNNNPPGDIKPAQTDSPAANPVSRNDNDQRQVNDRQDNNRQRGTPERARNDSTRRNAGRGERNDRESNLERQLAACLLTKNKGEVELGKFAAERAKDREVKQFAEQMIKDHSNVVEKLEQIVGSQEPNDRRSKIAREIDEQCVASLKEELGNRSEKEFDTSYIGSQIAGHMQMAATLKVIDKHATGQLSDVVKDARRDVDKHLVHAKKLMDQVDKSRDHSQAAKDRDDRTR
jgi:putative membrane protein